MADVKILQLQKDVEGFRRKLQDATDDKKKAISRLNKEFEQKSLIERDRNLKKWEVEKQEFYFTLETNIKLAKDKEIQQIISDKERDLRRMRDNMNYERDNAIRISKANSEEKCRTLFRQMQEESKSRDEYLTKEINLLSKEKESIQERISTIRKADLEKANIIKFLHYNHEKIVKDLNEAAKKDSAKEYKRYRSLEQYAHDKESEVNILNSKVLRLENDKEMLEKQVLTVSKFGEAHGSNFNPILAPRVITNREIELARKVRELEKELQRRLSPQRQENKLSMERVDSLEQTTRHASLEITSPFPSRRPNSDETNASLSSQSPSIELEEKLKRLQRQRHELRELVIARDQQIHQLNQRIDDLTHDLEKALRTRDDLENHYVVEKESFLMDHNKEMDELSMNNNELQEKLQECSSELIALRKQMTENEQSRAVPVEDSNIEQEAVLLQNKLSVLENNYKRSQKETLVTEALFSHWSSDQHVTIDSNDKVMQLELELSYTKTELREVQENLDGFQIRNEKLKLDYQKSRNDVDRMICQRERANDEKKKAEEIEKEMRDDFKELSEQISRYSNLDNELKNLKEKYIKTKERLTSRIEHLQAEIDRLRDFEMKALQVDSLKRELEQYKMNGNGNAVSPPGSPAADEIIKRLNSQISSQKEELNMQNQIIKVKTQLISQLEARDSPIAKLSAPVSIELNSTNQKPHTKYSPPKASPTRRTTSSHLISYDDSFPVNNNNNNRTSIPNMHGSSTLPRPMKYRPKLNMPEKSDEL